MAIDGCISFGNHLASMSFQVTVQGEFMAVELEERVVDESHSALDAARAAAAANQLPTREAFHLATRLRCSSRVRRCLWMSERPKSASSWVPYQAASTWLGRQARRLRATRALFGSWKQRRARTQLCCCSAAAAIVQRLQRKRRRKQALLKCSTSLRVSKGDWIRNSGEACRMAGAFRVCRGFRIDQTLMA